jgi:fructose-1-phosphate kinase PfkB-like protein
MDSESSQSIEDQRNDENFLSYMQNSEKKTRKKFTILDDLDELNERINGPGANEDQQKTKQIIQETFKNSHHPLSKSIEQPERPSISPPPSA